MYLDNYSDKYINNVKYKIKRIKNTKQQQELYKILHKKIMEI